jgi:4'-phosphopantetheinyl transferase EntD
MISSLTQSNIIESWKNLLPEGIFVSAGTLEGDFPPLSAKERVSIGTTNSVRMRELEAGRTHARQALQEMGIYNVDIPKNALTGAPIWPATVIGSITHSHSINNSHVATVVANSNQFHFLGIDAEWCKHIYPTMWTQFLTPQELCWLSSTPMPDRSGLACKVWTLKEAAIKAAGKGEMIDWIVSKSSTPNTFKLSNDILNEIKELDGSAICRESLALAVVYSYSN